MQNLNLNLFDSFTEISLDTKDKHWAFKDTIDIVTGNKEKIL